MNKKILYGAAVFVMAAMVFNVSLSKPSNLLSEISLANVEALADGESNPWYYWPFQGTTKDERSVSVDCEWNWEINLGIFKWGESGTGKKTVCENGGSENCWTGSCEAS